MFVGTGEAEVEESFAEYMAPLYVPEHRDACDEAVANVINASKAFDNLVFARVRLDLLDPLIRRIRPNTDLSWSCFPEGHCYEMPANLESALAALSPNQRAGIKRKFRRLRELDGFEIDIASDEASRVQLFRDMVELHNASWQRRGKPGVFTNDRFRGFHDELSAKLLLNGDLLLLGVRVGAKMVAVIYGICDQRSCRYYQSGTDLTAYPGLSVGILSHFLAADASAQAGRDTYDLLLSTGEGYKARIGKPVTELCTMTAKSSMFPRRLFRHR